jgi:hypothetical protein
MAEFKSTNMVLDKYVDPRTKRHYLNGQLSVLHCHHYSTLYSQLAIDAGETELLVDVAEESFYKLINDYFTVNKITDLEERIELGCQYYGAVGLGKMSVNFLGNDSGEVELEYSHLDSGWIRKWGRYDRPVNYIASGFINGMFSAILDKPIKTFRTNEIKSIVMGEKSSLFNVFKK